MRSRDDLLRAAVYAAHDSRGTENYAEACKTVLAVHALWPLIAYARAIETAQTIVADVELGLEAELVRLADFLSHDQVPAEAQCAA